MDTSWQWVDSPLGTRGEQEGREDEREREARAPAKAPAAARERRAGPLDGLQGRVGNRAAAQVLLQGPPARTVYPHGLGRTVAAPKPPVGPASAGQPPLPEPPVGSASAGQPPHREPPVGPALAGQSPLPEAPVGPASAGRPPHREPPVGPASAGQPSLPDGHAPPAPTPDEVLRQALRAFLSALSVGPEAGDWQALLQGYEAAGAPARSAAVRAIVARYQRLPETARRALLRQLQSLARGAGHPLVARLATALAPARPAAPALDPGD